jgi:hypothetical protein
MAYFNFSTTYPGKPSVDKTRMIFKLYPHPVTRSHLLDYVCPWCNEFQQFEILERFEGNIPCGTTNCFGRIEITRL